jgi:radical SAM superfamily enzyme YgiQ (UPF0313 family)
MGSALLISTYEMGRQPFGIASAAAWLRADGWTVACVDAAKQKLHVEMFSGPEIIAFHLPMHTATRLAAPLVTAARRLNAAARICAFGLYAPLNAEWLRGLGVEAIFGGEFEEELATWARGDTSQKKPRSTLSAQSTIFSAGSADSALNATTSVLPRIHFLVPDRTGLPPLSKYATLQMPDGERRLVGYTEASRGCRHLCRHCPVVPVYGGQFRVVQAEAVAGDIDAQVAAGARHITFGDPDFLNGPTHAMRVVSALHERHPDVSYDVTIKVEHLLKHRELVPRLAATGCAFVTSAIESIDEDVLRLLEKGHTRADFVDAVALCRDAGVTLVPTFVAFHPWLTLRSYCELLDTIDALDLVDHVSPIQLAIRLLVPQGSRLLELEQMRRHLTAFDAVTLTHQWTHPDPRVDELQRDVMAAVGTRLTGERRSLFAQIRALAHERAGDPLQVDTRPARARATVPYLNEPWYC